MNRYLDQRLKLRHFRIIEAVSQHSSLLRASAALSLAQPALTRSIHEIEEILGFRLYERHAKGVRETQFGEAELLCLTRGSILRPIHTAEFVVAAAWIAGSSPAMTLNAWRRLDLIPRLRRRSCSG